MTLDEALAVLERDGARHLTQRCSERDLDVFERALGRKLPTAFRALLARVGSGILYDRHEIFGARPLILHDIELVPDLLSVRRRLEHEGRHWPDHLVPIHRARGVVHLLDISSGEDPVPIVSETGQTYRDLPDFLQEVVLPPSGSAMLETA